MADEQLRPLVIAACFIIFYPMLVGLMAPISTDYTEGNNEFSEYFDAQYLASNTVFDNGTASGYNHTVDSSVIGDYWLQKGTTSLYDPIDTNADGLDFRMVSDSSKKVTMYVVMDNKYEGDYVVYGASREAYEYENFIVVCRSSGWWDFHRDIISIDALNLTKDNEAGEITFKADVGLSNGPFEVHIKSSTGNPALYQLMLGTGYSIYVSQSYLDQVQNSNSAWNTIKGLLTFDVSGTGTILDVLVCTPIWIAIVYVAYRLILAAIPFVGG